MCISLLKEILKVIYPPRCCFCGELLSPFKDEPVSVLPWAEAKLLQEVICNRCVHELPWLQGCCSGCGSTLLMEDNRPSGVIAEEVCSFCSSPGISFSRCSALAAYEGSMRRVLHRLKYNSESFLAEPLGRLLGWKILHMPWSSSLSAVVPVPLTNERFASRGYNQSFLIAHAAALELNLPLQEILHRGGRAQSQTSLNRLQRKANVKDVFYCSGKLPQETHVLLIDDVLTSGATVHEASSALIKEGAAQVSAAVIAR